MIATLLPSSYKANPKEYSHKWYLLNKDRLKERRDAASKRWREKVGREYINKLHRAARAKDRKENPDRYHAYQIKHKYGITKKEYEVLGEKQKWCCALCGIHKSKLEKRLSVDHHHGTKKVRGLLCQQCNALLGLAREKPEILQKAIEYLAIYV